MSKVPWPIAVACCLILSPASLRTACGADEKPLESYVPAGMEVTIRVDVGKFFSSPELAPLRDRILTPQAETFLDNIAQLTGVDLRSDVDTLLLAGYFAKARNNDGVILLQGRWDEKGLVAFFQLSPKYEEVPMGGEMIYGFWSDKDQEMRYAAFPSPGVAVLGRREGVEGVVNAQHGQSGRLTDNNDYKTSLQALPKDSLVAIAAIAPDETPPDKVGAALLKATRAGRFAVNVNNGVSLSLGLTATDEQRAKLGLLILQGALALAQMMDKPELTALVARVNSASNGDQITASVSMSIDEAQRLASALSPKARRVIQGGEGATTGGATAGTSTATTGTTAGRFRRPMGAGARGGAGAGAPGAGGGAPAGRRPDGPGQQPGF